MTDYESMKATEIPPRDLYTELRRIEERGIRMRQSRMFRLRAAFSLMAWLARQKPVQNL